jgi:hypothetical protein
VNFTPLRSKTSKTRLTVFMLPGILPVRLHPAKPHTMPQQGSRASPRGGAVVSGLRRVPSRIAATATVRTLDTLAVANTTRWSAMTTIASFLLGYSIGQFIALLSIGVLVASSEHHHG